MSSVGIIFASFHNEKTHKHIKKQSKDAFTLFVIISTATASTKHITTNKQNLMISLSVAIIFVLFSVSRTIPSLSAGKYLFIAQDTVTAAKVINTSREERDKVFGLSFIIDLNPSLILSVFNPTQKKNIR